MQKERSSRGPWGLARRRVGRGLKTPLFCTLPGQLTARRPLGGHGGPTFCASLVASVTQSCTGTPGAELQKGTLVSSHSASVSWPVK